MPRGTANTAERRLSSDCGPATPWWVWRTMGCTPRGTRTRRTNREPEKLRAPRSARTEPRGDSEREGEGEPNLYRPFQNSFSLVSIPYVPSTSRSRGPDPGST